VTIFKREGFFAEMKLLCSVIRIRLEGQIMFTLVGARTRNDVLRRDFLKAGLLGLGGIAMAVLPLTLAFRSGPDITRSARISTWVIPVWAARYDPAPVLSILGHQRDRFSTLPIAGPHWAQRRALSICPANGGALLAIYQDKEHLNEEFGEGNR
jgi:hypothetical protein